jgi:hypothetical protein
MARIGNFYSEVTATQLLRSLRRRGGCVPLHSVKSPKNVIQALIDRQLVRVLNTGCGFLLEITEPF